MNFGELRSPDGPEAANHIVTLDYEVARLRATLDALAEASAQRSGGE